MGTGVIDVTIALLRSDAPVPQVEVSSVSRRGQLAIVPLRYAVER
jgi:hypothetical protein